MKYLQFLASARLFGERRLSASLPGIFPPAYGLDPAWYLAQYPDVAAAGVSAERHFHRSGVHEGRLPNAAHARLWAEDDTGLLPELERLLASRRGAERRFAAWTLGRWHASRENWGEVLRVMQRYFVGRGGARRPGGLAAGLLWLDALRHNELLSEAESALHALKRAYPAAADLALAQANLLQQAGAGVDSWLAPVSALFRKAGLAPVEVPDGGAAPTLDNLLAHKVARTGALPLVSVVVPAFNAAATLETALRSLQRQSWAALEVLVVDDASSDATAEIAGSFAAGDARFRVLRLGANRGAYAARNEGVSHAQGDFITTHDSDDWSHPEKIARQVLPLLDDEGLAGSLSHWARSSTAMVFGDWRTAEGWTGWTHRNVSSLMIRRRVVERLGYWDRVACSADTEYYYRILRAFGRQSLLEVLPGLPLAFGRSHAGSLTRTAATRQFSVFGGARKQYHDAFAAWHARAASAEALYLSNAPDRRPFPAPEALLLHRSAAGRH